MAAAKNCMIPKAYSPWLMAADAANLLDHLGIARADVMGYSMGARIAAHMAAATPEKVRGLVLAGLGIHLVDGEGLPAGIADAMEAPSLDGPDRSDAAHVPRLRRGDPERPARSGRLHARLAPRPERGRGRDHRDADADLRRLRGRCCRRPRAAGEHDAERRALVIPGRDHNRAVGDKVYKEGVLDFLDQLPPHVG